MESKGTKPTRAREGIYRETPFGGLQPSREPESGSGHKKPGSNWGPEGQNQGPEGQIRGPGIRNQAQIRVRRPKSGVRRSKSGVRGLGIADLGLSALGIPGSELLAAIWATQASVPRGCQSYLHGCTARGAYTQQ